MEVYIPRSRFQVSCVLVCVCKVERDASAVRPELPSHTLHRNIEYVFTAELQTIC